MDIITAIEQRKSTRGFLNKDVPNEIIQKIIQTALRSPSATNVQPWKLHVVKGAVLDTIKNENEEKVNAGVDVDVPEPELNSIFKERRKELAMDLFALLDIKREDKDKRDAWGLRGHRLCEAPCVMFVTLEKNFFENKWGALNAGMLIQSICLAAMEYDVSTCITEQGSSYHAIIRKNLDVAGDEVILLAILLGYEDKEVPANKLKSKRAPMNEITKFYGM